VGDEALARAIALLVVGLFLVAQVVSYLNTKRPVPAELYPLTTMAVGYLLGHKFFKGSEGEK
jgi:hypothetical protein